MPDPVAPRRPHRANGVLRYQHLLDAAGALLTRDGSDGLTIRALARQAGVPMATVYHCFPGPFAVSIALSERYRAGFHELAGQPIDGVDALPWEAVVAILAQRGVAFYRTPPCADAGAGIAPQLAHPPRRS